MEHEPIDLSQIKGRRQRSRLRTCLPANVTTLGGTRRAILLDLSLTGARLCLLSQYLVEDAPAGGADAVLDWESGEAFGSIIWSEGEVFGLHFDEMLDPAVLIATRDLHDRLVSLGGMQFLDNQNAKKWVEGRIREA